MKPSTTALLVLFASALLAPHTLAEDEELTTDTSRVLVVVSPSGKKDINERIKGDFVAAFERRTRSTGLAGLEATLAHTTDLAKAKKLAQERGAGTVLHVQILTRVLGPGLRRTIKVKMTVYVSNGKRWRKTSSDVVTGLEFIGSGLSDLGLGTFNDCDSAWIDIRKKLIASLFPHKVRGISRKQKAILIRMKNPSPRDITKVELTVPWGENRRRETFESNGGLAAGETGDLVFPIEEIGNAAAVKKAWISKIDLAPVGADDDASTTDEPAEELDRIDKKFLVQYDKLIHGVELTPEAREAIDGIVAEAKQAAAAADTPRNKSNAYSQALSKIQKVVKEQRERAASSES